MIDLGAVIISYSTTIITLWGNWRSKTICFYCLYGQDFICKVFSWL